MARMVGRGVCFSVALVLVFIAVTSCAPGQQVEPNTWQARSTSDIPRPPARMFHSMVVSHADRNVIVFGGLNLIEPLADMWAFDAKINVWYNATQPNTTGRFGHVAATLNHGNRTIMVVFGGAFLSMGGVVDVYETRNTTQYLDPLCYPKPYESPWAKGSWNTVSAGPQPPARFGHIGAVLNNDLFIMGGFSRVTSHLEPVEALSLVDVWRLSAETLLWSQVAVAPSSLLPAAFPSSRAFALSTAVGQGVTDVRPEFRTDENLYVCGTVNQLLPAVEMVMVGGWPNTAAGALSDMWRLNLDTATQTISWTSLGNFTTPIAMGQMFWVQRDWNIVVGGGTAYPKAAIFFTASVSNEFPPQATSNPVAYGMYTNGTHKLLETRDETLSGAFGGTSPQPRVGYALVLVPGIEKKVILFGGYSFFSNFLYSDAWFGDFSSFAFEPHTGPSSWWPVLLRGYVSPPAMYGSSGLSLVGSLVLFGGYYDSYVMHADVWVYDYASEYWIWYYWEPSWNRPLSRVFHTTVQIDAPTATFLAFGGQRVSPDGSSIPLTEPIVVTIDPNQYTCNFVALTAVGISARYQHAAVYYDNKMYVFGGVDTRCQGMGFVCPGNVLDDAWSCTIAGSQLICTAHEKLPTPLQGLTAVYLTLPHASHRAIYLYGGATDLKVTHLSKALYRFDLQAMTWSTIPLEQVDARYKASAVALAGDSRMVIYGGQNESWTAKSNIQGLTTGLLADTTWLMYFDEDDHLGAHPLWEQLNTADEPPGVVGQIAVLKNKNSDVLLTFGGATYDFKNLGDLYSVQLGCNPGYASEGFAQQRCQLCPRGFYAPSSGETKCLPCPPLTTTPKEGATSIFECTECAPGVCNNGKCSRTTNGITCACNFGYSGTLCESKTTLIAIATVAPISVLAVILLLVVLRLRGRLGTEKLESARRQLLLNDTQFQLDEFERVWKIEHADLKLIEKVGEGGFGEVWSANWAGFQGQIAVKIMRQAHRNLGVHKLILSDFEREIGLLRTLRHENIVFFYGAGETEDGMPFFVTELCKRGSLRGILDDPSFSDDVLRQQVLAFMHDTAAGMLFLHSLDPPRTHRDLKADNLLVTDDWRVKVTDFGSSRLLRSSRSASVSAAGGKSRRVGTAQWMAPEAIASHEPVQDWLPCDVYSFAIVMWETWTREIPYANAKRVFVAKGDRPEIPQGAPPDYVRLMTWCWATDPTARPTFQQVMTDLDAMQPPASRRPSVLYHPPPGP
eukprot:m.88152 g.88152  ORF g.88152 m.88152 type:complete len:1239 (+) comp14932_c1_seq1:252-3968(+)